MRSNHKTASKNPAPAVAQGVIWASIPVLLVDHSTTLLIALRSVGAT